MRRIRGYINVLLVLILFIFIGINRVNAATLSVKSTTVNAGKTFTLTISDTNPNSTYSLSYDTSILTKLEGATGNGDDVVGLKKLKGNGKIEFRVTTSLKQDTKMTFILKDENQNDETKSLTINLKAKITNITTKPATTKNEVTTTIKQEVTNKPETTKPEQQITTSTTKKPDVVTTPEIPTTTKPGFVNANLKTLKVYSSSKELLELNPKFSPSSYEYTVLVPYEINKVSISAEAEQPNSIVLIDNWGDIELVEGQENIANIIVTAADGTQNSYRIRFLKDALDSTTLLKSIMIDEYEEFTLIKDKYQYDVYVNKDVDRLTINYEKISEESIVIISGNNNLKEGSKVKLLITAPNGDKKEYILNIVKNRKDPSIVNTEPKEKNPIIIMGLGMVAFILIGGIVYIIKNR